MYVSWNRVTKLGEDDVHVVTFAQEVCPITLRTGDFPIEACGYVVR